ncbi:hypothetical protein URS_2312 [Acinetobacter ursingii]|nr:hypothetical protein URS_2312 [Acinetobacter ursingii]
MIWKNSNNFGGGCSNFLDKQTDTKSPNLVDIFQNKKLQK